MQLTVKTLKGEKFVVDANASNTVAEVKTIIVSEKELSLVGSFVFCTVLPAR